VPRTQSRGVEAAAAVRDKGLPLLWSRFDLCTHSCCECTWRFFLKILCFLFSGCVWKPTNACDVRHLWRSWPRGQTRGRMQNVRLTVAFSLSTWSWPMVRHARRSIPVALICLPPPAPHICASCSWPQVHGQAHCATGYESGSDRAQRYRSQYRHTTHTPAPTHTKAYSRLASFSVPSGCRRGTVLTLSGQGHRVVGGPMVHLCSPPQCSPLPLFLPPSPHPCRPLLLLYRVMSKLQWLKTDMLALRERYPPSFHLYLVAYFPPPQSTVPL
jgi:hypothetical protein